jgi:HK97 family phage major capsid protein
VPANRIGALIGHPAVWKKMRKLATGITNDNTPLLAPAEVAAIPKLWTTAAPLDGSTAKCVMGDWSDLLFGVRQDIQVRVLNSEFLADTLSIAVLVYARVDFAATRAASFVTLEGLTVS